MVIHHLNCVSTCPLGGRLMDGRTSSVATRGELCCHCLLIETEQGLVLVDTGFGLEDVRHPRSRLSRFFMALVSPDFREEMTAIRQIERLGFDPRDVRHARVEGRVLAPSRDRVLRRFAGLGRRRRRRG